MAHRPIVLPLLPTYLSLALGSTWSVLSLGSMLSDFHIHISFLHSLSLPSRLSDFIGRAETLKSLQVAVVVFSYPASSSPFLRQEDRIALVFALNSHAMSVNADCRLCEGVPPSFTHPLRRGLSQISENHIPNPIGQSTGMTSVG